MVISNHPGVYGQGLKQVIGPGNAVGCSVFQSGIDVQLFLGSPLSLRLGSLQEGYHGRSLQPDETAKLTGKRVAFFLFILDDSKFLRSRKSRKGMVQILLVGIFENYLKRRRLLTGPSHLLFSKLLSFVGVILVRNRNDEKLLFAVTHHVKSCASSQWLHFAGSCLGHSTSTNDDLCACTGCTD